VSATVASISLCVFLAVLVERLKASTSMLERGTKPSDIDASCAISSLNVGRDVRWRALEYGEEGESIGREVF
jgi:hypothetical protein